MRKARFCIRLFGTFSLSADDGRLLSLGVKQQALLALLATAKNGERTRSWLQGALWSNVQPKQASGSLRNALSSVRRIIGLHAVDLISTTRERIILNLNEIDLVGSPDDGDFLEGIDIPYEEEFNDWLRDQRQFYIQQHKTALASVSANVIELSSKSQLQQKIQPQTDVLPLVAVLPLLSKASLPDDAAFGDALSEEVSRSLSRSQLFNVISHLSCRNFENNSGRLSKITESLDVDFLATGHVVVKSNKFHANIDLHNMRSGRLLWAHEFTGELAEFLSGDLDIAREIAGLISRSVIADATRLAQSKPLPSLECYELLVGAIAQMYGQNATGFVHAQSLLLAAIERAPNSSILHAWLAKWYVLRAQKGFSQEIEVDRRLALDRTARALDLDPDCSLSLTIDGFAHSHLGRRMDIAETRYRAAIDSNQSQPFAWLLLSVLHAFRNQPVEAISYSEQACRLSPLDPQKYYFETLTATALLSANDDKQALKLAESSLLTNQRHPSTLRVKTIALQRLGRTSEAKVAARELLVIDPYLTVSGYLRTHPAAAYDTGREWAKALRESGIPD